MNDKEKDILLDIHKKIWNTLPAEIQREKILALSWLPEDQKELFITSVLGEQNEYGLIVDELFDDILDRRGIKHEWEKIDCDVKDEIKKCWINKISAFMRRKNLLEN